MDLVDLPECFSGDLCLRIVADRYDYEFSYKGADGQYIKIATAQTKMLSSEVVGGCMGTWVGIYASGNGAPCKSPACFKWFEYEILPEKPLRPLYGD